eukprot:TRINITY_DN8866_c0_g1_i1.p1 TRINITY_DN8866_c0_g1~~TRINITY_DN8866_c0_g1_i1.p1  ORF type:complete len:390 (-),score=153.13 TRINITY_DN8866_c0_g1_i1:8-1177(-)
MKGLTLSTNERQFILGALREKLRIDGRRPFDFRTVKISFGMSYGHAEVQIGSTRVIGVVSAEVVEPWPDRPTEGFFTFNTEFSPMADAAFEIGRPSELAIELGRLVERSLRDSRAIDAEALCIKAGDKVWSVRCDLHVVDHGGNLIDCASLAAVAALLHFRRPATALVADQLVVYTPAERPMVPLSVHHTPLCVSFALFDSDGSDPPIAVVDPALKEEAVMDGRMTLTINAHMEMCAIQKAGGTAVTTALLMQCARIAAVKADELNELLQAALRAAAAPSPAGASGVRARSATLDAATALDAPVATDVADAGPQPPAAATDADSAEADDAQDDHDSGDDDEEDEEDELGLYVHTDDNRRRAQQQQERDADSSDADDLHVNAATKKSKRF